MTTLYVPFVGALIGTAALLTFAGAAGLFVLLIELESGFRN
jgi:hypothetical protein